MFMEISVVERRLADSAEVRSSNSCQLLLTRRQSVLPVIVRSSRQTTHAAATGPSSVAAASVTAQRLSTLPGTERCGTESNPWNVVAWRPGQRVNVTAIDLTMSSQHTVVVLPPSAAGPTSGTMTTSPCRRYVRLRNSRPPESSTDVGAMTSSRDRDDCGSHGDVKTASGSRRPLRESLVFSSDGANIEIVVDKYAAPDNFLLVFKRKYFCCFDSSMRGNQDQL